MIVALKIVTPNSETAPSLEENKENIRQMASADAVDNGNSDSKTTSTTEVPMEVEGSGETNTNESVTNSSDSFTNLEFRIYKFFDEYFMISFSTDPIENNLLF